MVVVPSNPRYRSHPKKPRKITLAEPVKKVPVRRESMDNNFRVENFLICYDCKHNTITYEPNNDGACSCGCHL